MKRRFGALMAEEGLEYGERTHTYNSRLAQELAVWGDEAGVTDALHDALFRAYFVEARNLALTDVVVDVAATVGLDAAEACQAMEERRYRSIVDAHWERARNMGVTGVPTYIANRQFAAQGAETSEKLAKFIRHAATHEPEERPAG